MRPRKKAGSAKPKVSKFKSLFSGSGSASLGAGRLGEGDHIVRIDAIEMAETRNHEDMVRVSSTVVQTTSEQNHVGQDVSTIIMCNTDFFLPEVKRMVCAFLCLDPSDDYDDTVSLNVVGLDAEGNDLPEGSEELGMCENLCVRIKSVAKPVPAKKEGDKPSVFVRSDYQESMSPEEALEELGEEVLAEYFPEGVVFYGAEEGE